MGHPALLRHATKGPLRQQRGSAQLQLPQHRGQTRRSPDGRDSPGGSGTLCSSGSAVPSLLEFAGDKLCRFPELPPRSNTVQPSSSTAACTPTLTTTSSPGEAKDRLLLGLPSSPVRRPPGAGRKVQGSPGGRREPHTSGQKRQREEQVSAPPIKVSSACTVIPGRREAVYCLPHGNVTSCSRTSGRLT